MKRFLEYLQEKFFKGHDGRFGYVEIFKNPTPSEMHTLTNGRQWYQLGAIMTDRDLYVWDRKDGEHSEIKRVVGQLGTTWLPLYIYYDHTTKTCEVDISLYTADQLDLDLTDSEVVALARKHPALKPFRVERHY